MDSFNKVFSPIENFLDVSRTENGEHIVADTNGVNSGTLVPTDYVLANAKVHCVINLAIMGVFSFFSLLFILRVCKIKNFD